MTRYRFDRFVLDCADRQLRCDGAAVDLNARYLDALTLLAAEQGRLVSKDRFLDQVWRGVPVTDEALTQCIKTLRHRLGDSAAAPRFIETVPKHGYRFIAPVEVLDADAPASPGPRGRTDGWLLLGAAGTLGGGLAGLVGGILYGFAGAAQPGTGAISILLVLTCATVLVALVGGAGVAFAIAAAGRSSPWSIAAGAGGGLLVGAVAKLLGLDGFALLLGHSPGNITGAPEGALLGAAVGLGYWLASRTGPSLRRRTAVAALPGAAAGLLIPLLGGRLMAGSLDVLARSFPGSRFRLDPIGHLLGEASFGPIAQIVTGMLEGALFSACVSAGMFAVALNQHFPNRRMPQEGGGAGAGAIRP